MNTENRISVKLAELKAANKKALSTYIVAGDPRLEVSLQAMQTLVRQGADIIELGVPFSDPMAEGPVIQKGHERALAQGTSLRQTLALVAEFRRQDQHTPVVVMGYTNPIERFGYERFAVEAAESGVDGVITVDLPPEELENFNNELKKNNIHNIFLLAPTSSHERIQKISAAASGFLYYVSLKGVTGAGHLDVASVREKLTVIRGYSDLPLLVGFGIKNAETTRAIGELAEGVVVGSALVNAMGEHAEASPEEICQQLAMHVSAIRDGLDSLN